VSDTCFDRICIVGIGLIGSSLARAIADRGIANTIVIADSDASNLARAKILSLGDQYHEDVRLAVKDCDLVILCVPVGIMGVVAAEMKSELKEGAIITDVGSVKESVLKALLPHIPDTVHLVPGHPVAGTEKSGPDAGLKDLFVDRWAILTPPEATDQTAIQKLKDFWQALGSKVELMDAKHHDLVLAITSHVPHLIAYNIVGTASDLEEVTKSEVIKYSAGGFRDFTRIAASDPTMWRDVFLGNKEAVLEMLGRFSEDLTALQRAIRWDDADGLFELFSRTREIRSRIIDAGQDSDRVDFGRPHGED
jgi:cyclohexadieny/prephenate dehydrogenase